jgi:arginase family enzyme
MMLLTVAPGTGTPDNGGWTSRELRTIVRGMEGLNVPASQNSTDGR